MNYICVICLIVLIIYMLTHCFCLSTENYENNTIKNLGIPYDKNDLTNDTLFSNVTTYQNDDKQLGIEKCLIKCNGKCVEFGVTGVGMCFPNQ